MGDTRQENDSILGQDPKNCLLNAAVRLTFTEDLVVKHGWTYFYRTTWGKKVWKRLYWSIDLVYMQPLTKEA